MRAATEVGEVTLTVQAEHFARRDGFDDLGLVGFANRLEVSNGFIARQLVALDRNIRLGQLGHFLFDGGQIVRGERALVAEVVVKAVFDGRADGHLRIGEQRLDRVRQQVGAGVANDVQAVGVAFGDNHQVGVVFNQMAGVHQLAVHFAGQGGAGQAGANRGGHACHGDRLFKGADGTIGQSNVRHVCSPGCISQPRLRGG